MSATRDVACTGCALDRRTFFSQSTLVAVAALLVDACGTGVWEPLAPVANIFPAAGLSLKLADYPALAAVGGIARVDEPTGAPLAVARMGAATFVAISLSCPHQGTTLDVAGSGLTCPNHGARFAIDGTWTGGQLTANLTTHPLVFNAAAGTVNIPAQQPAALPTPVNNGHQLVVTLAKFPELATIGGMARVDGNSTSPLALVRTGGATFVALSMRCTHQGATVAIQSGGFFCPRHAARFSATGAWLGGQRTSDLTAMPATYSATTGTVTITIA